MTPVMIKLIAAAAIAVIAMIIIGGILSSNNSDVSEKHQMVYARINSLVATSGPIEKYRKRLNSSDLRAYASQLLSSLQTSATNIKISNQDVTATEEVTRQNSIEMTAYTNELQSALIAGHLDKTFAYNTSYQLQMLIILEQEALAKSTNTVYSDALNASIHDLQQLQEQFEEYSNTH